LSFILAPIGYLAFLVDLFISDGGGPLVPCQGKSYCAGAWVLGDSEKGMMEHWNGGTM